MRMTHSSVVGLSVDDVVLCYADPDVGGACRASRGKYEEEQARRKIAAPSDASSEDTRLLPPLPWGSPAVFLANETGRVDTLRLNARRFVVCFERVSDAAVICSLGFVTEGSGGSGLQCAFGNSLQVGSGRLMPISPASAGRQIVACHAATGNFTVTCRWADVVEPSNSEEVVELRWVEAEPRVVASV